MDVMNGDDESKDAETKTTTRVDLRLGINSWSERVSDDLCYVKIFLQKHIPQSDAGPVCPFVCCVRECYLLILLIRLEYKKTGTQKSSQGLSLHGVVRFPPIER